MIRLTIIGLPAPKGSKTKMPGGKLVEGSSTSGRQRLQAWDAAVAWAARQAIGSRPPLTGPLAVAGVFRLPMPKSRPAAVRQRGVGPHAVKPDLDKIQRATFDALKTGGLLADDALICRVDLAAIEVTGWTGAALTIGPWDVSGDCERDCQVVCAGSCQGLSTLWREVES